MFVHLHIYTKTQNGIKKNDLIDQNTRRQRENTHVAENTPVE